MGSKIIYIKTDLFHFKPYIYLCNTIIQFLFHREHAVFFTKANKWMLFKIVINFYSEKHKKSINTLFKTTLILNQMVQILATILKSNDVKNISHWSHSNFLLLESYSQTNFRNIKYKTWNGTKNILFTLTQNNANQHYAVLLKIYCTSEASILT
jgi:hypothetical protein